MTETASSLVSFFARRTAAYRPSSDDDSDIVARKVFVSMRRSSDMALADLSGSGRARRREQPILKDHKFVRMLGEAAVVAGVNPTHVLSQLEVGRREKGQ